MVNGKLITLIWRFSTPKALLEWPPIHSQFTHSSGAAALQGAARPIGNNHGLSVLPNKHNTYIALQHLHVVQSSSQLLLIHLFTHFQVWLQPCGAFTAPIGGSLGFNFVPKDTTGLDRAGFEPPTFQLSEFLSYRSTKNMHVCCQLVQGVSLL